METSFKESFSPSQKAHKLESSPPPELESELSKSPVDRNLEVRKSISKGDSGSPFEINVEGENS